MYYYYCVMKLSQEMFHVKQIIPPRVEKNLGDLSYRI